MDLQILAAQITGIEAKLTRLREQAAMFQRAAGLDEAAEKARADREEAEGRIAGVKKQLADLQTQKGGITQGHHGSPGRENERGSPGR